MKQIAGKEGRHEARPIVGSGRHTGMTIHALISNGATDDVANGDPVS